MFQCVVVNVNHGAGSLSVDVWYDDRLDTTQ